MRQLGGSGKLKQIELKITGTALKLQTYMLGLHVCDIDMNNTIDLLTVYTKGEIYIGRCLLQLITYLKKTK